MIYSRHWQYGLRILLALAKLEPGERVSAGRLARRNAVPAAFASKILSRLTAAGLVRSRRGPNGGVALALPASRIRVRDVASALGEAAALSGCILGFDECSETTPCPVHDVWKDMRANLQGALLDRSLDDFAGIGTVRRVPRRGAARRR